MAFSVEELRPANPIIIVNGKELEISLITLHIDSKIKEKFEKLENIFSDVKKNPLKIFDALWILILDKAQFQNNKKEMMNFIYSEAKTSEVTISIMNAIQETIGKSMPIIKNRARYEELLRISQSQNESKVCYGVYYDRIAKRYSYTIDQFYNLTLRQLHILLHVVGDQSYEEIEIQAALQGRKLKPRLAPIEIDEKEDKAQDNDAKEIHERLMKDYKEKQGKK